MKYPTAMVFQALNSSSAPLRHSFLPHHQTPLSFLCPSLNVPGGFRPSNARFGLRRKRSSMTVSASSKLSLGSNTDRKRKVVEHICLLKAKDNIPEKEENNMLDYLYTSQYQMGGIVAISLGQITDQNNERYTHAVFMRFQRKGDLLKFYENPFYLKVLEKHVMPHCHGLINVDYEAEVEDDMLPIFRKGEEFNFGEEFVLLISFVDSALGGPAEDALASLQKLTKEFPSLIVQLTQGLNFHPSNKEFTHGIVIRFRSIEALEIFFGSSEYKDMWRSKFEPITQKTLALHFSVNPIGTEIM
ncbi:hypothetical protein CDL15_Pgr017892 [Punica granatum]|uniref:Stress-response A/B barrel domain-containing protein n=1 Tax=Punica granatum TaxID=22663 RepID=A0A218WHQ8_PUNGR|nr:hypothetical protein CDL15_Pgr017892 [Punica granatum]